MRMRKQFHVARLMNHSGKAEIKSLQSLKLSLLWYLKTASQHLYYEFYYECGARIIVIVQQTKKNICLKNNNYIVTIVKTSQASAAPTIL